MQNKKKQNGYGDLVKNIVPFVFAILHSLVWILLNFSFGGLLLYACKAAQANIGPTDSKCFPYTENQSKIEEIGIDIFRTGTEHPLACKIRFPNSEENRENFVLNLIRSIKTGENPRVTGIYFGTIFENLFQYNYGAVQFLLSMIGRLPEWLIILFGPLIIMFASFVVSAIGFVYLIYSWLINLGWLFKYNINESGTTTTKTPDPPKPPDWETRGVLEPSFFDFVTSLLSVLIVLMILGFGFMVLLYVPIIVFYWCLFTYMLFTSEMKVRKTSGTKVEEEWKEMSGFTVVANVLKYYKMIIMILFSLMFVKDSFKVLGEMPGIFSILVILLIYFDVIPIHLFTSEVPPTDDLFEVEKKFRIAKKSCPTTAGAPDPTSPTTPTPTPPPTPTSGGTKGGPTDPTTEVIRGGRRRLPGKTAAKKAFDRTFVEGSHTWVKPLKELLSKQ